MLVQRVTQSTFLCNTQASVITAPANPPVRIRQGRWDQITRGAAGRPGEGLGGPAAAGPAEGARAPAQGPARRGRGCQGLWVLQAAGGEGASPGETPEQTRRLARRCGHPGNSKSLSNV